MINKIGLCNLVFHIVPGKACFDGDSTKVANEIVQLGQAITHARVIFTPSMIPLHANEEGIIDVGKLSSSPTKNLKIAVAEHLSFLKVLGFVFRENAADESLDDEQRHEIPKLKDMQMQVFDLDGRHWGTMITYDLDQKKLRIHIHAG